MGTAGCKSPVPGGQRASEGDSCRRRGPGTNCSVAEGAVASTQTFDSNAEKASLSLPFASTSAISYSLYEAPEVQYAQVSCGELAEDFRVCVPRVVQELFRVDAHWLSAAHDEAPDLGGASSPCKLLETHRMLGVGARG